MSKRLKLEKLVLKGYRKDYKVEFKSGLNFISGPTSTGKSSIAEMIDYALGDKDHKKYIEIRESCKDVQLDFSISKSKYRIVRPLFDFQKPVKLFRWNDKAQNYNDDYELLDIKNSVNQSLSSFLLEELGLPKNLKIFNQKFSFRDLFKYSYISQTVIDSEDLLKEKQYGPSLKRRPTIEIIFNIYDQLLDELKTNAKAKSEEINVLENRRDGVDDFLKGLDMVERSFFEERKLEMEIELKEKTKKLTELKGKGKLNNSQSLELEHKIIESKEFIVLKETKIREQLDYLDKLFLLRNQYDSEIDQIEFIIDSDKNLKKFEFEVCPSCLHELNKINNKENECTLCGTTLDNLNELEIKAYKSELKKIKRKNNSLSQFITDQETNLSNLKREKQIKIGELQKLEFELDHLRKEYVSPFIEQIERFNFEIGSLKNKINEIENSLLVINNFYKLNEKIRYEKGIFQTIKDEIKSLEANANSKEDVIKDLSEKYSYILSEFSFPKLADAFLDDKYLPFARGVKYDQLGSLGAVTMVTMAYFLSILIKGIEENNHHPGLLIIDSPRKNLGSDSKGDDEFKDEAIFNSIITYFIHIHKIYGDELQLIVINNGHPEFLDDTFIAKKFDGDGTKDLPYGLIDDMEQ
ncbi:AAA family ATPase [Shimazuella sp. AN120528]|uniref:AAA family ATPase n=1 Tax=Shimazuella soli TaxID=1892854 RepID=UPI001F108ED6|nr:AAA family ATPase [Shimazuella soli]MCH5586350.1 AAA family ATPase [Shimazuella soli]